jgi:hypothetical protein
VFVKLRAVGRELSLPVPAVSPLLDMAVDGSAEALARLLALAPLARGAQHDEQLELLLSKGLADVADASADELIAALRAAPAVQSQAAVELVAIGLTATEADPAQSRLARLLKDARGADAAQAHAWLVALDRQLEAAPATAAATGEKPPQVAATRPSTAPSPASAAAPVEEKVALPRPEGPINATSLAPIASAAAAALTPTPAAVNASYGGADPDWPVTVIPNPAWVPASAKGGSGASGSPAAGRAPGAAEPQACTAEASRCSSTRDPRPGG